MFPAVLTLPFSDCVCLGNKLHLLICKTILPVISVTQVLIPGVFSLLELESPSLAVRALSAWDQGCLGNGAERPPLGWVFRLNLGTAFLSSCVGNHRMPISHGMISPESVL